MNKNQALIAMSGGVDSAVAALLLKDSYNLTGITMYLWNENNTVSLPDGFCPPIDDNSREAQQIASALGFPHLTVSLQNAFCENIIKSFISEYRNAKTPNPCVNCNRVLKFGRLFEIAQELNIPYLATGHYAKIVIGETGEYELHRAADLSKDQSYFLWGIKKELLPFILFPLGDYTKPQIRELAARQGFTNASRSDSQDICFVPDGNYISFIEKHDAPCNTVGNFIDTEGNILGQHGGIERYTIGQRKGLGIALGVSMFVGKKNITDRTVTLCSDNELYRKNLRAHSTNLLTCLPNNTPLRYEVKIRYRHTPAPATVIFSENNCVSVEFDEAQRAISPGQSVVFYDKDRVIGGGIIE